MDHTSILLRILTWLEFCLHTNNSRGSKIWRQALLRCLVLKTDFIFQYPWSAICHVSKFEFRKHKLQGIGVFHVYKFITIISTAYFSTLLCFSRCKCLRFRASSFTRILSARFQGVCGKRRPWSKISMRYCSISTEMLNLVGAIDIDTWTHSI